MSNVTEHSERMMAEIKRRALDFVVDNEHLVIGHLSLIETVMMIGASITLEQDEAAIQLRAWQEAFGTNQLTHALARLKAAESDVKCLRELDY